MHALARRALNVCALPDDLGAVTFRDAATEDPAAAGVDPAVAEALWRSVEALYRTGVHPGIQLSLRHRACRYCTGHRSRPG